MKPALIITSLFTLLPAITADAYSFAPGHDAWVVGDEEVIGYEFNNTGKDYAVWQSNK